MAASPPLNLSRRDRNRADRVPVARPRTSRGEDGSRTKRFGIRTLTRGMERVGRSLSGRGYSSACALSLCHPERSRGTPDSGRVPLPPTDQRELYVADAGRSVRRDPSLALRMTQKRKPRNLEFGLSPDASKTMRRPLPVRERLLGIRSSLIFCVIPTRVCGVEGPRIRVAYQ